MTHEEWVNAGRYESLFGAPPPANPVRDTNRRNFGRVKIYADWYNIQGFVTFVRDQIAAAKVKHLDETGYCIGGITQWLHIAATRWLTWYRTSPKRGSLPHNFTGVVVHDHWNPYYTLDNVTHALCNAHHLRELRALIEIEEEDWAGRMRRLLRRACHATNIARERGMPMPPRLIGVIERAYDRIVTAGLAIIC